MPFILTIDRRMCKQESAEMASKALKTITNATKKKKEQKTKDKDK